MALFSPLFYRIYYTGERGATLGSPLVLLHGLMGYGSNWARFWPHFSPGRPVLALDQRGHGRSKKPSSGYTLKDYATDLKELLNVLSWDKVHLMGHSMGGRVAILFSSLYPNQVSSLLLEDVGAFPSRIASRVAEMIHSIPTPFSSPQKAKLFLQERFSSDPIMVDFLYSNMERKENSNYDWRFSREGILETIQDMEKRNDLGIFSSLRMPTLLVRGEKSVYLSKEDAEKMKDSNPNVELSVVQGAGHLIHFTHSKELAGLTQNFISSVES